MKELWNDISEAFCGILGAAVLFDDSIRKAVFGVFYSIKKAIG